MRVFHLFRRTEVPRRAWDDHGVVGPFVSVVELGIPDLPNILPIHNKQDNIEPRLDTGISPLQRVQGSVPA